MSYNIIGDIAGNYKTLQALLAKMPEGTPVSVGDMVDRGPSSKQVLEFFKNNGLAVLANHEHMMLSEYLDNDAYQDGIWLMNGGGATVCSFFPESVIADKDELYRLGHQMNRYSGYFSRSPLSNPHDEKEPKEFTQYRELIKTLPKDIMDWIAQLPMYLELDGPATSADGQTFSKIFISHAPKRPDWSMELCMTDKWPRMEEGLLWNRGSPRRMLAEDGSTIFQAYGHNSYRNLEVHKDKEGVWGYCIDTSWGKKLTGVHWPSLQTYEQEYID